MSFADFVFNIWGWLFPALRWFVTFLVNPAPDFFVRFVNDFGNVITFVSGLLGVFSNVPIVNLISTAVIGVLTLIQSVFTVLSGILNLPFGVTLIALMIVFAIICVILDLLHKCFEAVFDLVVNVLDIIV